MRMLSTEALERPWFDRTRAFMIHLALSAAVAALCALIVFGAWFPTPFREISGGRELFTMVVAVDVVLGPVLTFAIFDRRKPSGELRRDLAAIVLLQLGGLAYGLQTAHVARPVLIALEGDRLRVVRMLDLTDAELSAAPPELQRLPRWGIAVVATRGVRHEEKAQALKLGLEGRDVGMRPEFWLPSANTGAAFAAAGRPLDRLRSLYPSRTTELDDAISATGKMEQDLRYLPMLARRTDWVALIDARNGSIVGYAPFDGN